MDSAHRFNMQAYKKLERFELGLQQELSSALVVHADKTGIDVLSKLKLMHAVGSSERSLFDPHQKHGSDAMHEIGS